MKSYTRGFTLIELMVVIAVLGVLMSIAVPAYRDYVIRSQTAEAFSLVSFAKPKIVDYFRHYGHFPANNKEAGLPAPDKIIGHYVGSVRVDHGAIHVTFRRKNITKPLQGQVLTVRPLVVKGSPQSPIAWLCGNAEPPSGMKPIGENHTTLNAAMLPSTCR